MMTEFFLNGFQSCFLKLPVGSEGVRLRVISYRLICGNSLTSKRFVWFSFCGSDITGGNLYWL